MDEMPSSEQLILLVNSLCEIQDRIMSVKGMPKYIQQPIADKVEPLKAPMFFVWERLGYGSPTELSPRGIKGYWMASFNTSPPDLDNRLTLGNYQASLSCTHSIADFLSECIQQLRSHEIPIAEYDKGLDLQQSLINFYSELQELYEL